MYFSGQHGSLYIADKDSTANPGDLVCAVRNWSYTIQQQALETTALSSTDRTITHGIRSLSGQATLFYYEEAQSNVNTIAGYLVKTGTTAVDTCDFGNNDEPEMCKLRLRLDGASTHDIGIFAYITSFAMSASVGEVVTAEISFEGTGAPFEWSY